MIHTIHGDARELAQCGGPPVDVILTDAPYPTVDRYRTGAESCRRLRQWFPTLPFEEILDVFANLAPRLVRGGFLLAMCDFDTGTVLADLDGVADGIRTAKAHKAPVGKVTGLRWRCPWVWRKTYANGSPHLGMGYYGRRSWEQVLVLQAKGTAHPEVIKKMRKVPNVRPAPVVRGGYPTEKPPELGFDLLSIFAPYGGRVLDPFAGAGRWITEIAEPLLALEVELWDCNDEAPAMQRKEIDHATR